MKTVEASYVLRVYQASHPVERIDYELALLEQLRAYPLPFAIPTPLLDRHGQRFACLPGEAGTVRYAVLWRYIPGANPSEVSFVQALAAGQALGQLAVRLATLSSSSLAGRASGLPCERYGCSRGLTVMTMAARKVSVRR